MTVITFAKQGTFYSSFDSRHRARCQSWRGIAAYGGGFWLVAAALGIFGALAMFAMGIHTMVMTLTMAERAKQISSLEEKTEAIRIEALKVSNPQYLTDRARMLQLRQGSAVRYVTLGRPEELAAK